MQAPRRFLPSISLLSAFEAAARTGSVTQAARELSLTQSAVSRQIKVLEGQLGVELFHREKQTIRLSYGGEIYAREVREALQRITNASLNLRANPAGGALTLAILPTFGTRWLAPRLPGFMARHPEVSLNLLTRLTRFDFRHDAMDAAIHFGTADWPGTQMVLLRRETVQPLCAPELLQKYRFQTAQDFRLAPLLHLTSRPDAWERWMRQYGADDIAIQGMLFDQFATLSQAAISGLGVALLPAFLFQPEIEAGQLVPALPLEMTPTEAYYLCWPHERDDYGPLRLFRDWLIEESAPFRDDAQGD